MILGGSYRGKGTCKALCIGLLIIVGDDVGGFRRHIDGQTTPVREGQRGTGDVGAKQLELGALTVLVAAPDEPDVARAKHGAGGGDHLGLEGG